jgi:hypothetical protein
MFRSGTTLLARMLHTHREIVCASDPFRPFFNCLRDDIARELELDIETFAPLGDYFAHKTGLELFGAVQQATLDRPFPDAVRSELRDRIVAHAEPFSPRITARLDAIHGDTFRDVYDDLWSYVPDAYGDGGEQWEATKEVWTTEFTPVLADSYPESKFIHVVRDPRAVCASKNVQKRSKYPWLFLIRQWRKLATLSQQYDRAYPDRVRIVRYEDLVQSPRETATDICDLLDIDLDESILDPANFVDGAGEQWLQNTSYDDSKASFDTSSVAKWRTTLTDRQRAFIEQLCYPEMASYGYDHVTDSFGLSEEFVFDPPRVPRAELADWISEYYGDWDRLDHVDALANEQVRQQLLTTDRVVDDRLLEGYFLTREAAETARAVL